MFHHISAMHRRMTRHWKWILPLLVILYNSHDLKAQNDSIKTVISTVVSDTLRSDSTKVIEDAALDIGQSRGVFIISPDKRLQLRIVGSVRYLVAFDNRKLTNKNSFNTFDIPTGTENFTFPNLYNGLEQSRLGFEITRSTDEGNLFVRLETDFAGPDGYRIRHAYGQFSKFLFGQTWSLFSHITSVPATVDFNSPTGATSVRTPQIRYSLDNAFSGYDLTLALEYFRPELTVPDTLAIESVQLIPDITARIEKNYD
jgi:hypothetical protein